MPGVNKKDNSFIGTHDCFETHFIINQSSLSPLIITLPVPLGSQGY